MLFDVEKRAAPVHHCDRSPPMPDWLPISFTHPALLALLVLAPLAWWLERRSLVLLPRGRRIASLALRTVVILLLVLALAGMRFERRSDAVTVVFAVDRSDSVGADEVARALAQINASLAAKRPRDMAAVVVFGEEALVEAAPGPANRIDRLDSTPRRTFTDISRAIRLAVGLFPEGTERRIVLFTDANENLGNAAGDARMAAAAEIPIDVVPLRADTGDEVLVESVQVPERLEEKRPFEVRIGVRSTYAGPAVLRMFRNRAFIGQTTVELEEGKNIFAFPQENVDPGFHTYEAMIDTTRDAIRDNNQAGAFTLVYGRPRILLVGADEDTRFLREALELEELPVDTATVPPADIAAAERYDAVMLCNVGAETVTDDEMRVLRAWCGDLGGGLAMTGGGNSFGPGGWRQTPVEEALPLSMDIRNKKNFPSLGLMILVDKSGSMSGTLPGSGKQKVELAAEAAVAAVEVLTERDHIGVIGFDSAAKWDCPFQQATDKRAIAATIRSLRAGGGTDAMPAFNHAIDTFRAATLQLKHIILISDGMVSPGDFDRVTRDLRQMGVTVTTVGVGPDADRVFLDTLARTNGGRAYFTSDPGSIPRIFTKEAVLAQRSYLVEEPVEPVVTGSSEILKGLDALPALAGYVAAEEKERAETLLKSHKGDPLLAAWRYRSGKSLAWTSDTRDRWAAQWVAWEGYRKFWGQATRWVMRSRKAGVLTPRVAVANDTGRISVDAVDQRGEFVNFLALEATVIGPDLEPRRVRLRQTSPGQYEAPFEARDVGAYIVSVAGEGVDTATAGASVSYSPEYRSLRTNRILAEQIASLTGGRVAPPPADFFRPAGRGVVSPRDLWQHLLGIALLLFVADIAARRLFLDEEQRAQIAALAGRFLPTRRAAADPAVAEVLGALKARRGALRWRKGRDSSAAAPSGPGPEQDDLMATLARVREARRAAPPAADRTEPPAAPPPPQADGGEPASAPEKAEESHTSRLLEARRRARTRRPD